MWLSNSSVGRKLLMALSGAFLVLFVTFHCLMNAVAIVWPWAYNLVCEFLGANWYALIGTGVIALFVLIHIIFAVALTLQNRKARGSQRYSIAKMPATVEWSSQNMLVLGFVVVAFMVLHLIQFWAKMQLPEAMGVHGEIPASAGTLFLQKAFETPWTVVVYIIGFVALWFHLNHGFWSMFQSIGWNNTNWMPRLKKISCVWVSVVVILFVAEAAVFTYRANQKYYLTNETLREQYKDMIVPMLESELGPEGAQIAMQIKMTPYEGVSMGVRQMAGNLKAQMEQFNTPEGQKYVKENPQFANQVEGMKKQVEVFDKAVKFFDYLESADNKPNTEPAPAAAGQPQ